MNLRNQKKYSGFTLLEMLLVMTIFIILFGMSIAAFSGLRTTILTNQTAENFKLNTRWTQRAAVLLKRKAGENWLYGVGLDFSKLKSDKEYRIFKWCSPYEEYIDGSHNQSLFPNFQLGDSLHTSGNLPVNQFREDCDPESLGGPINNPEGDIAVIGGRDPSNPVNMLSKGEGIVGDFTIPDPLDVGMGPGGIAYVLFEAISGNIFYYDVDGLLLGYDMTSPYAKDRPGPELRFIIADPDHGKGIEVKLNQISGKVELEAVTKNDMGDVSFE